MKSDVKKVCFLLGGSKLSGAEKRIIITALEISKDNSFDVRLITTEQLQSEFFKSELSNNDLSSLDWRTRKNSKSKNKYVRRVVNLIKNTILNIFQLPIKNSYIHIVLYSDAVLLSILPTRMISNSSFFYEVTSPDVAQSSATKRLLKYFFLSDKLICVSKSVEERLAAPSNINLYTRQQPLAYFGSNEISLVKDNLVVYAHRLVARKNPMLAAEAFTILATEFPEWDFYICGDGELKNEVETAILSENIQNFKYRGYVYEMDKLMERSKIFVSLIEPDNYPSQSVFNAMANGNALIVSDTGFSKDKFIKDNGYAVDLTVDDIVKNVRKLIIGDEIIKASQNSLELFNSEYKPELYFDECKGLYL